MSYHVRILAGPVDNTAGSHVYHREMIRRLAARGHRVSVICFQATPEVHACAEVVEIPRTPARQGTLTWRLASWIEYRHFTRELMARTLSCPDVVVTGEHLLTKGHWQKFPQTPLIYFPHAPVTAVEIEHYMKPGIMRWVSKQVYGRLQRWTLNHADRTVRFTRRACQTLLSYYGSSIRPRFCVNPAGVDLPDPSHKVNHIGEVRLLSVGRLVQYKGLDLALTALSGLRQYPWRLDIVGEGKYRPALERRTQSLELAERVHFHGFQPDLLRWYDEADLFLFPSKCEGFGLVLLDAMSHGVPCLGIKADGVTYVNMNEEIIDHGNTGLLAENEADFTRQLERALQQPGGLTELGRAARRRIAEHHTWDKHLDRYEELFDELLNGRKPS
jgi:glycosyltransferase involved in cell wall biosynthesis